MTVGYALIPNTIPISGITNDYPAIITLTGTPNFVAGGIISLRIYKNNGIRDLNQMQCRILAVDSILNKLTVDLDTRGLGTFVYNATAPQPAQAVPVGSGIDPLSVLPTPNAPTVTLAAEFDNIPVD